MINYLHHEDIDFNRWDNCIKASSNAYIYAYSWYLNIVAGEWDALIEDDYVSVFPLPYRKKYGIKYIYQPPFTQQLGLFSTALQDITKLHQFVLAIPNDFRIVEINLNKYYQAKKHKEYSLKENTTIELDLSSDFVSIQKKFSTNLKRNLKKAKKRELQIDPHIKPEDLINLFKSNKGNELNVYSNEDYNRLGRLMYTLIHKGKGEIQGVRSKENNLLAAALFIHDQQRYIFLFSGLNNEGKAQAAMPFLISSFIESKALSQKVFDFEGSNNPSLARFYQSFGGSQHLYYGLRYYRLSIPLKVMLLLKKKWQ